MKLSVIGTGYVGLVTGACFAEMGNTVTCVDADAARMEALRAGRVPFHEPGLPELVASNRDAGRLRFGTSVAEAVADAAIHFITVGTPLAPDGSVDLSFVIAAAADIGRHIRSDGIVAIKSTVPVGTAGQLRAVIAGELKNRVATFHVDVVSNPEFLKQGAAVGDCLRPDRVVIGADSDRVVAQMRTLYAPFTRDDDRLLVMGARDAELTKYAANAMLATRISFMNEIAALCEKLGVDVENVRRGIGSDSRIGHAFLQAGSGYGGSCLPKDVRALAHLARANRVEPRLLQAVESRNEAQKQRLFEKIRDRLGTKLAGATVGVWGLAFKPDTDDVREAPALVLIRGLIEAGAKVRAYDPAAMDATRGVVPAAWLQSGQLEMIARQYDAATGADALALVTEWKPFRNPDFEALRRVMRQPLIFDGRNQYDAQRVRALGFEYFAMGR